MGATKEERREARYGPPGYLEHVTHRPCSVPGCKFKGGPWGKIEFAHWRAWGSGHGYMFGVPLCRGHHAQQHSWGILKFQKKHQINLERIARRIYDEWLIDLMW